MNRLQVGGLALITKGEVSDVNVGKTVELTMHLGSFKGLSNAWFIYCEEGLIGGDGEVLAEGAIEAYRLLPIGGNEPLEKLSKEELVEEQSQ